VEFNPFDVTTKELIWDGPGAWLERFDVGPPGPAEVIDSDITTLTAAADKVIKVGGPEPYLVNIELQSSHDKELVETTWFRQAALYHRHKLPVLTVLVLLRREANSPSFTGSFEIRMRDGWRTNQYNYRVVRMWDEDPEPYLTSGINLVPLAPLTNVREGGLPGLIRRMEGRINAEPQPSASKLWTATYLLMGLCYSKELVSHLLEGVRYMRESTTYQAILGEGRVSGEQRFLILLGTERFGKPDATTLAAVEAIRDIERLEALGLRIVDPNVRDWNSLLAAPSLREKGD
jgi:predicted transposase YdaD